LTDLPHNPAVEDAVIGQLLATPDRVADVVGALLEPEHFYTAANRLLFGAIRDGFYDGTPIDALTLGELHAVRLGRLWGCEEAYAVQRVRDLAHGYDGDVVDHAQLVKRDADYRALLAVLDTTRVAIVSEDLAPEQIAGELSQSAMKVATNTLATSELTSFADAGRDYVRSTREAIAARSKGIELGAYFGIAAIDQFMRGLRGGEVAIGAGEPGVGKSAVWWKGSLNFAERQALRPVDQQVGTAVVSLEMGKDISNARFAAMMAGLDTTEIREGTISAPSFERSIDAWRKRMGIPMWLSYQPSIRASQLRALCSEAVRKHNVGLVVVDHFGYFHLDRRLPNKTDEDGEKARFLKELAGDLNIGIVCLAHTRKPDPGSNGRPRLSDLRGSQEIAGHAWLYATERERDAGKVDETEAIMIHAKNRNGFTGEGKFVMDASRMYIS
jgi:replicative DNA helicase